MPTISYSIGGEQHDISGKSGKEVVKMVEEEYAKQKKIKFNNKEVEDHYAKEPSISYADMREIVAIQHKGESHKEGEDLDQFIDCMTKIRMEQHTKIEDKVEALLNQLVFPDEMIVEMSKLLSPKQKKIKFNIKKVEEEEVACECCEE